MTTRRRLPNRRRSETAKLPTPSGPVHVTIGFHPDDGDPLEVFLRPASARSGSDLQFLADDAAIILSLCLQYGVPIDVIGKSLSRQQGYRPASLLAAVADHLALIEKGG